MFASQIMGLGAPFAPLALATTLPGPRSHEASEIPSEAAPYAVSFGFHAAQASVGNPLLRPCGAQGTPSTL
jgi:hypothetical protein